MTVGVLVTFILSSPVAAHAAYKDSDPPDESSVASAPGEIWAEFTEPPSDASYLEVYDPCGEQIDAGDSRRDGYKLYISMSGTKGGTYRVAFFVSSATDNHTTRGEFTFTVTNGDDCLGAEPKEPKEPRSKDRAERPSTGGNKNVEGGSAPQVSDPQPDEEGDDSARSRRGESRGSDAEVRSGLKNMSGTQEPAPIAAARRPPKEPGIFEDIPRGGLVVGLLMSAVIGAGGGLIYAGIMGYRRP